MSELVFDKMDFAKMCSRVLNDTSSKLSELYSLLYSIEKHFKPYGLFFDADNEPNFEYWDVDCIEDYIFDCFGNDIYETIDSDFIDSMFRFIAEKIDMINNRINILKKKQLNNAIEKVKQIKTTYPSDIYDDVVMCNDCSLEYIRGTKTIHSLTNEHLNAMGLIYDEKQMKKKQKRIEHQAKQLQKIQCECGGIYTLSNKKTHYKSNKHNIYMKAVIKMLDKNNESQF